MRLSDREALSVTLVTAVGWLYADDWLIGASILVLWLIWKLTATRDGMKLVVAQRRPPPIGGGL